MDRLPSPDCHLSEALTLLKGRRQCRPGGSFGMKIFTFASSDLRTSSLKKTRSRQKTDIFPDAGSIFWRQMTRTWRLVSTLSSNYLAYVKQQDLLPGVLGTFFLFFSPPSPPPPSNRKVNINPLFLRYHSIPSTPSFWALLAKQQLRLSRPPRYVGYWKR